MKFNFKKVISLSLVFAAFNVCSIFAAQGSVNGYSVNIRTAPSTDAEILATANTGESFEITSDKGDWYGINYNGKPAYIYKNFLNTNAVTINDTATPTSAPGVNTGKKLYAIVNSNDGLNLRSSNNTSASVVKTYSDGAILNVISSDGEWVKVVDANGTAGYVSSDYVNITSQYPTVKSSTASKGEEVIAYAKQFIGTPYVWAGNSLTNGVDCSGFTSQVYKHFGISLSRCSGDQAKEGTYVEKSNLQPGDIIYFNNGSSSNVSHVGLYVGNGKYIHSTDGYGNGVCISDLYGDYALKTYAGARRVLN